MQRFVNIPFFLCAVLSLSASQAANLPAGFSEKPVATALSKPTAMAFAPDGRLFICQQDGSLRVVKAGTLLSRPFLTLDVDALGERGLLGVAFDPSFASNEFLYVYYTAKTPAAHNRVSRFTASGDTVLTGSELILLDLDDLSGATNHNGGAIHFGPDGMLYIAVGENATPANSQSTGNLLGKILRMSPDGSIPADGPFYTTATGKNRLIWALGLRNPFTFAFQRGTGLMFINDVGASSWEEINRGSAGANYGWPATEGFTSNASYRGPIFTYPHGAGTSAGNCIAGGAFYDPPIATYPATYVGRYFFADYVNGWIKTLRISDSTVTGFATSVSSPVDLQIGPDGNLYYLARGAGAVYVVQYTPTGTDNEATVAPGAFVLEQNYPNPFNPLTVISCQLPAPSGVEGPAAGPVKLAIYDLLGREVAVLMDEEKGPGRYEVQFDAGGLPSGTYVYRLRAGTEVQVRAMVLVR